MKVDKTLFYLTVGLMTISVIFVYSLSLFLTTEHSYYGEYHFLIRQLFAVILGITIMWYISRLDPDKIFIPLGMMLFIFFLFLMGAMHFFPAEYVKAVNGAKRWIKTPLGFSVAPVEFFKIGFIWFLAWSFSRKIELTHKISITHDLKRFSPYFAMFFIVMYLVAIMQNDFGQVLVMGLILLIMGFMAGISSRLFIGTFLVGISAFLYITLHDPNRLQRYQNWLSDFQALFLKVLPFSWKDKLTIADTKTQISYSYDAIINGGLFGTGIGNGVIKLGFLPEIHTDFILSGIAEEIGAVGLIAIILIYFFIIYRILKIANRLTNKMYSNFAFGIALLIGISFFINAFGVTGAIPIKGIAVPLLSYGGSSIVANSIAIGMIIMISKRTR